MGQRVCVYTYMYKGKVVSCALLTKHYAMNTYGGVEV
jgi:hypothetical protein